MDQAPWWRNAVVYEVYVRSFLDSSADGVGDLAGVADRVPYLSDLGVDALWLTPFYPSPMADGGYDVADFRGVDPLFGDLAAFDALLATAHRHGLRIIIDLVPNHTSSAHPWFAAALAAPPDSPERDRYIFRAGSGPGGDRPPNNWRSVFGGPAWSRLPDGAWYLHLFAPEQPDLNWRNPEVAEEFAGILRFWLDRGVDGFRIDVAMGLFKDPGLPDIEGDDIRAKRTDGPVWNRPELHGLYRTWRRVLDGYDGDRMAVGEIWTDAPAELARYVRPDELHQAFTFDWLRADWSAAEFREVAAGALEATAPVGAANTWVLANHDVVRQVTRFGGGAVGLARARAALLATLALPGSAYLYQGEELGLPEVTDIPEDALQDPIWERSGHRRRGRDGCRVPIPWAEDGVSYGFGPDGVRPWLPMPVTWSPLSVQAQDRDPGSTLNLYRRALRTRRAEPALHGAEFRWLDLGPDVLAFTRSPDSAGPGLTCVLNCGTEPVPLPPHTEVLLTSTRPGAAADGELPADTAVWLRTP
ncbi:MAG: DUF3459 domain-containing protein [Streptosporangiales bacterium]|nr:DUF3459 domain-containing protein [Streptosporangiales bacterium]